LPAIRRKSKTVLFALAVLIGALCVPALAEDVAARDKVASIAFSGLRTLKPRMLMNVIRTRVGDTYDRKAVNEDVKLLTRSGFFEWVTVTAERTAEGVKITFRVSERIFVAEVLFLNNKAIKSAKLTEIVGIAPGQYLDNYLFQRSSDKIAEAYREKGYVNVRVTSRLETVEKGARCVWVIEEGILQRVKKVSFEGNRSFSAFRLGTVVATKAKFLFFIPGVLRRDVLKEDIARLADFYHDEGFFDAKVSAKTAYSADKAWVQITFVIEEGPRYRVGTVKIEGNKVLSAEQILAVMKLKGGVDFSTRRLRNDIEAIRNLYGDSGYIDLEITPQLSYHKAEAVVDLVLKLVEHEQVFVRRVDIDGNFKTRDNVIRRRIRLLPGQPYSRRQLHRSLRNLRGMGLFSSVDFRDVLSPEKNFRDVIFAVEETTTASIIFGGAVSSNEGFFGTISFVQRNFDIFDFPEGWDDLLDSFSGAGQTLRLEFRPGTEFSDFLIYFREPSVFDSPYGVSFRGRFVERARERWDESRAGLTVGVSRRFGENWVVIGSVRVEDVDVDNIDDDAPVDVMLVEGSNAIRSLELVVDYDNTDSRFAPTEGLHVRGSWEIAAEALGGDWNFNRLDLRGSRFWPVYETRDGFKHVFMLSGELGSVSEFGDSDFVPIFERYFAGGSNSVRGFGFRDLGPSVDGTPVGGEVLFLASAEYLIPLWSNNLRGVLFADAGGVFPETGDFEPGDIRVSVGFGLKIVIPAMGPFPLSFDWGFPLNAKDTDDTQIFSFNIRTNF